MMKLTPVMPLLLPTSNLNKIIVQKINLALFRITLIWLLQNNKSVRQLQDTNHFQVQLLEHLQGRTILTLIKLLEQEGVAESLEKMLSNLCLEHHHSLLPLSNQSNRMPNHSHLHMQDTQFLRDLL